MLQLPRLAVGTFHPDSAADALLWALLDVLQRDGVSTQLFHSRACFPKYDGATPVTGLGPRHLDSWIMSADLCRDLFVRGSQNGDLSIVEGTLAPDASGQRECGGQLAPLCQWLDLPRVAVLDVARLGSCCVPPRPPDVDALLLDGAASPDEQFRVQTSLEALWQIPVLGGLERLPALRGAIRELPPGSKPPREILRALGDNLSKYFRRDRLRQLAESRPLPAWDTSALKHPPGCPGIRVAVAFDDAFNCYFPDTLDLLELLGADVVDFSLLHDESLPAGTDIVYLGCGHPERYAAELMGNHCMTLAMRNHLCAGRRIYGEGGGLAYLCQHFELPSGELVCGVGALPAVARRNPHRRPPRPVEVTLRKENWLGEGWSCIRGYLNSTWMLEPCGPLNHYLAQEGHELDLVGRHQAIGSRLHINFAAQGDFLRRFVQPHPAALELSGGN